jgi:hypothetical protein
MRTAIWLLLLQASLGAFDTLYYHGFPAWMLLFLAAGVFVSGVRDLIAGARPAAPA